MSKRQNSLCIIGDKYKSLLLMLGNNTGSNLYSTFDVDINNEYKNNDANDDDDDDDDDNDEISQRAKLLNKMGHNRHNPGLCYEELQIKYFVVKKMIEIYDIKKNKWRSVWRRTQNNYYNYPSIWTHPINPNILFIAGDNEYIDYERCYLYHLGVCEWRDLRSNQNGKY